ncbi:MAG: Lrp/AsnC family transcriptional regulator [Zestosphaera sp.]
MDEKNRIILSLLLKDASISLVDLSKTLGISVTAVKKRLTKMKNDGVLKQSTVVLDFRRLGYEVTAFIKMSVDPSLREYVVSKIAKLKNVIELYEITGEYDLMAKVVVTNMDELRNTLLTTLTKIGGINRTSTMIVLRSHDCNQEKIFGEIRRV